MSEKKHLARLERIWVECPIYFVTTCTYQRESRLASEGIHGICRDVWRKCEQLYGWIVGRYVVMPDHVHFFCATRRDDHRLKTFVGKWKEWTAKYATRRLGLEPPLWQEEFFDHLLRSHENYEQKWNYLRENPVRAGLVVGHDEWVFQGELHDLRYD